jgi:hypothetical protein
MESNPIGRSALFAKQMDEQLWFESTALRLMRTWCNWITHRSTKLKSEGSSPSVLAIFCSRYLWRLSGMDEESVLKTPAGHIRQEFDSLSLRLGM